MSRSQPEIAGLKRFGIGGDAGTPASADDAGGKIVELCSSGTDFILMV
jgi:hypothetical protein